MKKWFIVLISVGLLALGIPFVAQNSVSPQPEFLSVVSVKPINLRSYVRLIAAQEGNGSGVVIKPGVLLTAKHVAEHPADLFIEPEHIKITTIRVSKNHDLALVSAPGVSCPCVRFPSDFPNIDDPVSIIGFPLNDALNLQIRTEGVLQGISKDMYIATASATFGNSGGGLFWKDYLIGILVQMPMQPVGFEGMPVNYLGMSVDLKTIKEFLGLDA